MALTMNPISNSDSLTDAQLLQMAAEMLARLADGRMNPQKDYWRIRALEALIDAQLKDR